MKQRIYTEEDLFRAVYAITGIEHFPYQKEDTRRRLFERFGQPYEPATPHVHTAPPPDREIKEFVVPGFGSTANFKLLNSMYGESVPPPAPAPMCDDAHPRTATGAAIMAA